MAMDQSGNTQNRRSRRSHLLMSATLEVSGRAIAVKLRNLSADGAQVEGDQLPVEGTELLFRKGELAVPACVIWTKGKQAGIGFARRLEPQAVLNHIAVPRPRMEPEFRRPGLASRALTEQERKLAEHWIPVSPILKTRD
jgi:hypothetical protein